VYPELKLELQQIPPVDRVGIEPLTIVVEWMRYCEECDGDRRFVAHWRCDVGLIAKCSTCGELRIVRVSRSEGTVRTEWEDYT